jgi:single-stranded DNA-binding protein
MHQPINQVHLRGFLTEPARTFISRSGQPRLTFRLEVWIDDPDLPPKKPLGVDYFSVVAFGAAFVTLAPQLTPEREVAISGRLRSRDLDGAERRVVTEIVAQEISPLGTRAEALREQRTRVPHSASRSIAVPAESVP